MKLIHFIGVLQTVPHDGVRSMLKMFNVKL